MTAKRLSWEIRKARAEAKKAFLLADAALKAEIAEAATREAAEKAAEQAKMDHLKSLDPGNLFVPKMTHQIFKLHREGTEEKLDGIINRLAACDDPLIAAFAALLNSPKAESASSEDVR